MARIRLEPPDKLCAACRMVKPISDFYRHPETTDGHFHKCKECTKHDAALRRAMDAGAVRAADRARKRRGGTHYGG